MARPVDPRRANRLIVGMANYRQSFRKETRRAEKFWKSLLRQYCENTSLHGFRYVVSQETTVIEKIVWLMVCFLGFGFALLLMVFVWDKYRRTPTVTTIDTTTHPIFSLNFPAVSICNYNKVYKPHAEKFAEKMRRKGLNDTEISNFFTSLPKLIRPDYIQVDNTKALEFMSSENIAIDEIMHDMMQPCDKLLLRCAWEGKTYDCNKIFKPIKSIEGYCCAFNYHVNTSEHSIFGLKEITKQIILKSAEIQNLTKENPGVYQVLSVPGAGRDVGLSVVLNLEKNTYFGSIRPSLGASILVHDPFIYPEVEVLTSFIQPTQEIAVILSASIMESSVALRNLDLKQRNCWFTDEKKLNISSIYSYQSCITECRIKYIRRYCSCIPFYYPNNYHERVCSLPDVNCLTKYRGSLSNLRTVIDLATENNTVESADCECLPTCDEDTYTSNSENAFMENVSFHSPILDGFNVKNVSLANIYFRGITCLKYRKESWMSWDNVLASFGGIFGLCVGGSFVSLVEFLYYFVHKLLYSSDQDQTPNVSTINKTIKSARPKFKLATIESLDNGTEPDQPSPEKNTPLQPNISYLHELQIPVSKSNLQEDFIRNFLKSYK